MQEENRLYEEDQALVDKVVSTGIHSVERKPFKPFKLLMVLFVVVTSFTVLSLYLAHLYDAY
ncbi:DUF3094 domain-containing protein [Halieaceae bacterium]|jgi:hypothetical protein|nr:DUF3094 domain-containing protein [Halieaceae bacterium]